MKLPEEFSWLNKVKWAHSNSLDNPLNGPVEDYDNGDIFEISEEHQPNIYTSKLVDDEFNHMVIMDIDVPVRLIKSTNNYHLVFPETSVPVWKLNALLYSMALCGIVEKGYSDVSKKRGHASLRLPWVKKNG